MSRPGPFAAETELQPPRKRGHVNAPGRSQEAGEGPPVPDTQDPARGRPDLIQACDRLLKAAQRFVDGNIDFGALRAEVVRYRAAVSRAGLAGGGAREKPAGLARVQSR